MWSRSAAAAGLVLGLGALSSGQSPSPYSRAVPPDATALARLNLRIEWAQFLPIAGGRDTVQMVQTIGDQLFVQTRTGHLIAVDARTGRIQWQVALGNGGYSNVYPVAANDRFVYVAHVTRAYAFYRDTGVLEFTAELGTTPVAGLSADARGLYAPLATQPGAAGEHRVLALELPNPIVIPDLTKEKAPKAGEAVVGRANPVDQLTDRYPAPGVYRSSNPDQFDRPPTGGFEQPRASGGGGGSRSPSLAAVPRVTPPYTIEGQPTSPSLQTVPSLRQPYRLHDDSGKNVQRTPSIGTIPPSVSAALALTDLRPQGVKPKVRWEYGLTTRIRFAPVLTPSRVWIVTDSKSKLALGKADRVVEVDGPMWEHVAAAPGRAGIIAYVPLSDGSLLAVDLEGGNRISGVNILWRTNVGGILNHTPVVTEDAVFASGDHSGVVRVDRATGAQVWRTDRQADRLLAVNQDFAYVRDTFGKLLVYDARRPTEANGRAAPLTSLNISEFNIPVVNTVSDRLFLAADNGLIVCLRDAARKYDSPVRMAPPVTVDPVPRQAAPPAGMPPVEAMPKVDPPPAPPKN
ncbi:MAG: PQQ-binding-like beta-propeller repeat protein [Gemmataceae bacterium]